MSMLLRIRTFTLLALAASVVVAPACDEGADAELAEQLGVSVEELAEMSAEELDALESEFDLTEGIEFTHHPRPRPDPSPELWQHAIVHTHGEAAPVRLMGRTRPTHGGVAPASGEIVGPIDDSGCDTHGDELELAAR